MKAGSLYVEGAAENNLVDVDVALGAGLTAIVGVSGSGKSSLAFDVVYHEARRRLLDSLSLSSPWSRVPPARVRHIRGLAPAVALGQDSVIRNPSSTVAPGAAARSRRGRRTTSACARPRSSRELAPRRFAARWPRPTRLAHRLWSCGRTDAPIRLRSRRCVRTAAAACRRFAPPT